MSDLDGLRYLYSHTAPYYESQIAPLFAPLAFSLAEWALRCAAARFDYELYDPFDLEDQIPPHMLPKIAVLRTVDLGTGTGLVARHLTPHINNVIGLDISPDMLHAAQINNPVNVISVQADLHALPMKSNSFQLVTSSFGLNASTPDKAIRAVRRILQRGSGLLVFQEWGAEDDCSRILDETLAEFALDESLDPRLDTFFEQPTPWYDKLQDTDDYYVLLKQNGFELVWVEEDAFVDVELPSIDVFIQSKMAWPSRRLAFDAMTSEKRDHFQIALQDRLTGYINPDGSFLWKPMLFRVCAVL
jgi:ubiquinone/menaquinone biosynthesis C-methylase UbiE